MVNFAKPIRFSALKPFDSKRRSYQVIRPNHLFVLLGLTMLAFAIPAETHGHMVFKKYLAEKFPNKKLDCYVCHVKGQKKDVNNSYGKLFTKVMKKPELTMGWKALRGPEKKTYEKDVMVPAFDKAYKKISKMTFEQLIKEALIDGVKDLNPPKNPADTEAAKPE
jgi:hypothetical protein